MIEWLCASARSTACSSVTVVGFCANTTGAGKKTTKIAVAKTRLCCRRATARTDLEVACLLAIKFLEYPVRIWRLNHDSAMIQVGPAGNCHCKSTRFVGCCVRWALQ